MGALKCMAGVVLDVTSNYESVPLRDLEEKCSYIIADLQRRALLIRSIPNETDVMPITFCLYNYHINYI